MVKQFIVFILTLFSLCGVSHSAIIFSDDFDSQADYGLNQNECSEDATNYATYPGNGGSLAPPTGWNMAYSECSYYVDKGHNTIEIDSNGAMGGSGKGVSFWSESDTRGGSSSGWASDGQIGYYFPTPKNEVYVRLWVKFPVPYLIASDSAYTKMVRLIARKNHSASPFDFFNNGGPNMVQDITSYGLGRICITDSYRYNCTYYPDQATPYHTQSDIVFFDTGSPGFTAVNPYGYRSSLFEAGNLGDGEWHMIVYHFKLNSSPGTADGVFRYWIDGTLSGNQTNLAWIDSCGSMETGQWDFFTLGGNCYNHYAPNAAGVEQPIYFDEVVIADTYQEAIDGPGGTPTYDAPIVEILTSAQSTTAATITIIGTLTTDSELTGSGVDVDGVTATADDGTFDEAVEAWTALGVTLSLGANTITATGMDSESETDTDTISITRTAPPSATSRGKGYNIKGCSLK